MSRFETTGPIMATSEKLRIDWVDYAKGICIILVVMMHTTLGVEKAAGHLSWLHGFIDWARPFRMPDFFLISGLFLAARIDKPWREYLDTKVLHFAYFYILWMTLQLLSKAYGIYLEQGSLGVITSYAMGFVEPFGTLWFIYMLAIFFVVTKLVHKVNPIVIFAIAALLEILSIETGSIVVDEFASRYVYFFAGYWLAPYVFKFANAVNANSALQIFTGLIAWGLANYALVHFGLAALPFFGLVLGFIGAAAVISTGVLMSKFHLAEALRYCGKNSIIIYLSFFLFMGPARSLLLRYAPGFDLGQMSLFITALGVAGPVLMFWATRNTVLKYLFVRPEWAKLSKQPKRWHNIAYVKPKLHTEIR
jgi:uncharacterized membrane protein YcfT